MTIKQQAIERVERVLAGYELRGIPRLPAIRAGIRELELRGLHHTRLGAESIKQLRRLEVQAKKEQKRRLSRRADAGT